MILRKLNKAMKKMLTQASRCMLSVIAVVTVLFGKVYIAFSDKAN